MMRYRRARMIVPLLTWSLLLIGVVAVAYAKSRPPAHVKQTLRAGSPTAEFRQPESQIAVAPPGEPDPNSGVYATPDDCFAAYTNAVAQGNVAVVLSCLVPTDRDQCVGWYVYYLDREIFYDRPHADASKRLLEAYGIKPGMVRELIHEFARMPAEYRAELVAKIGGKVDDPIAFAVEAANVVTVTVDGYPVKHDLTDLSGVEIRGSIATGNAKHRTTGNLDQIIFKQLAGSWLIATDL